MNRQMVLRIISVPRTLAVVDSVLDVSGAAQSSWGRDGGAVAGVTYIIMVASNTIFAVVCGGGEFCLCGEREGYH